MAHELTINVKGQAEMMYVGKKPWHGLGQKLDNPATWAEAMEAANLTWEVRMDPVYLHLPRSEVMESGYEEITNKKAAVRVDTGEVFGVMSDRYTPLQNTEFGKFFDAVVGAGEAIYDTAGSLNGGRRVWGLAKLPKTFEAVKGDTLETYVLLANSHDGSMAVTMRLTTVRVVCANTWSVALGGRGETFRALHTPNLGEKAIEAREFLGLSDAYFANMMAGIERMVETTLTEEKLDECLFKIFDLDDTVKIADQHYLPKFHVESVKTLTELGQGLDIPGVKHTAWGAFNAITEYVDHISPVGVSLETAGHLRQDTVLKAKRLDRAWFGDGAKIKQQAWNILVGQV